MATQREQVTVTARSSVLDRQSTAIVASFDSRQLADLFGSRNMSALLAMAQAVQMPNTEVAGGTGALVGEYGAYGTSGANRPTVEGIVVQGIFNSGGMLDYGSFEEASVLTAAHGPEVPTYGVHLQFVTKTGGNRYRGTLYADYENRAWQSHNVDDGQIADGALGGGGRSARDANRPWHDHDVNADVGGFISKDKLGWYSSIRDQNISSRLVKFLVRPHRTCLTNYGGKGTYQIAPGHTLVGFAQKGRNHQPNCLDWWWENPQFRSSASSVSDSAGR